MSVKYTSDHEWVSVEGDIATIGITDYAQEQLGELVFVELPGIGAELEQGGDAAVIESVKAASEIYAAVSGEVTAVNDQLEDAPTTINTDPMGDGWIFKVRLSDASQLDGLMDETAYKAHVAELE